jgi:pimeloyl-ACP methyl ester carboxylesterase
MPFFSLARLAFSAGSWLLLILAAYLLWTGYVGQELVTDEGDLLLDHDPWRLWLGGGLLMWCAAGRFPALWLTTRSGGAMSAPRRGDGRMVETDRGSQLYVEERGDGAVVILTHGWGMDSTIWRRTREGLGDRLRVVVWDLPGLGRSRPPRGAGPSLEGFARDLRHLVLAHRGPVTLVGHSIGGMIIQTLARDHPELFERRISRVVLLNTTYTDPSRTMVLGGLVRALRPLVKTGLRLTAWLQPLAWASAWQSYLSGFAHLANRLGFGSQVTWSQLEHTTLLATRNPPGVQALGVRAMLDWDADRALAGIGCPVLIIGGTVDVVTKLEASEHIAQTCPKAALRPVPGANHMGFLEQADAYNLAMTAFISDRSPATARP